MNIQAVCIQVSILDPWTQLIVALLRNFPFGNRFILLFDFNYKGFVTKLNKEHCYCKHISLAT